MHAVVLHAYGPADQLKYEDVPEPPVGPNDVKVRVKAISINPVDWKLRSGHARRLMELSFPAILGRDVAGVVEAVGAQVTRFKPGDRVMGLVHHGYAELVTEAEEAFAPIPDGMDFETAATLPLVVLTGEQLILEAAQVQPDQVVLVTGAVGSVGRVAVHAAIAAGCRVIAGVREEQKQAARALGAAAVVDVDDLEEVRRHAPFDVVADTVGGEVAAQLVPLVKPNGVFATTLGLPDTAGQRADVRFASFLAHPDARMLARVAEVVKAGELEIPIGRRFPLAEASAAQEAAEAGHIGKVVLLP